MILRCFSETAEQNSQVYGQSLPRGVNFTKNNTLEQSSSPGSRRTEIGLEPEPFQSKGSWGRAQVAAPHVSQSLGVVCVVTSQAVLDSSNKGNFWRRADPQVAISWQSQQLRLSTGQGRGPGVGPMVSSRGGLPRHPGVGPWSWIPGLPLLRHPALSFISTYWPGGGQIHRPCGLQVAIINWDLAEFNWLSPGVASTTALRVPALGPFLPLLALLSLTHCLNPLAAPGPGSADCCPHLPGWTRWMRLPQALCGLRRELSATPGLQLGTGDFLVLAFENRFSSASSRGSGPKET